MSLETPGGAGRGPGPRRRDDGMLHIWSTPRYTEIRNHGKQPGWSRAGLNGPEPLSLDAITGGPGVRNVGKTASGGRHPRGREDTW